jgi:hypothetical protein
MQATVGQGAYIHMLNKERLCIHLERIKILSKCWSQVPEV